MKKFLHSYLVPLILVVFCPPLAMIFWYTNIHLDGSFANLLQYIINNGFITLLQDVWFSRFWGSPRAWTIILIFAALQILMMQLPAKTYKGNKTPNNHVPEYKDNGLLSYCITLILFFVCSLGFKLFDPAIVYNNFGDILAALNISALVLCVFLYCKGRFFPSTKDHGLSKSLIFDYYWGTELYPRILGLDLKLFIVCRFGMTGWALAVSSFAFSRFQIIGGIDYGILVSALLIDIYLFKFFIWESGYMKSMDIQVDRAGFYICWGCLVWVPGLYTTPVLYMVKHSANISLVLAIIILVVGIFFIFLNYWADLQRQVIRATNGNCKIWFKKPKLINAKYTNADGSVSETVLLASGFWGISRHFHYIPELLAALVWSITAGINHFMPLLYFVFLTILLVHRSIRDDIKCNKKYGVYWKEYTKLVPYKIIPFIF